MNRKLPCLVAVIGLVSGCASVTGSSNQSVAVMKPARQRVVNLASELRSGRHYGVFIDDTGSPGLTTPGLHAQRKSWVAARTVASRS